MAPRPLIKISGTRRKITAPYRRWTLAVTAVVATLLVGTLLHPPGSTAAAAAAENTIVVNGFPGTQAGLKVWRSNCIGGEVAEDDWDFNVLGSAPPGFGTSAVGWAPTDTGGTYGIETYFPSAPDVDVFRTHVYAPAGQTSGFAQVNYYPRPGNTDWIGYTDDFVDTTSGWHTVDASQMDYDWFRLTDGEFDDTVVQDQTIAEMTDTYGAGAAWFQMHFGCDGNPFYVDGYQVGSSVTGWNSFDFEDYLETDIALRLTRGPRSTCGTSPKRFPATISFRGIQSPGGPWEGQQFVGRRHGKWRVVARGTSPGSFGYRAKVRENSWFDAVHPWTINTAFNHSEPDWYIPAFPSIKMRAVDLAVRKGTPMVFTGSIKPAKKLSYTVLQAVPKGRKWSNFRSRGTFKTDNQGRFRFTVRTPTPGWARINILTQTEKDLTSTLTPQAIVYQVLKPKKKPKKRGPTGPAPQPSGPPPPPDYNAPDPGADEPPTSYGRPRGFGKCRWVPVGGPPRRPVAGRTVQDGIIGGDRTEAMVTSPVDVPAIEPPAISFGRYDVTEAPGARPGVPVAPYAYLRARIE